MTRFTDSPYERMMTRRPEGGKKTCLLYTSGKEWGGMGQNYLRSLLALGFQAFLIIVCVAIYAVLVQNIALEDDILSLIHI